MVFAAAGLLSFFAAQVVSVSALQFSFKDVPQCAPLLISFTGHNISVTPNRLLLLPINSTATSIPLGDLSVYTTGISLGFVPYAADTSFIASIDDSNGVQVLQASGITRVLPSPTGNSSCVSVSNDPVSRHFTIASAANQCEPITVMYDNTVVKQAPAVRLFNPKGNTLRLNLLSDDPTTGTATYMLNFSAGKDIVLLMDEGNGTPETSPLMTVGGNAFNKSCFSSDTNTNSTITTIQGPTNTSTSSTDNTDATTGGDTTTLSQAVIIGGATGGCAVVFVAISMAIFVVQERKKRVLKESLGSASLIEKGSNNDNVNPSSFGPGHRSVRSAGTIGTGTGTGNIGITVRPPTTDGIPNPFAQDRDDEAVMNPPYTSNSLFSTMKSSNKARGSMASWAQAIPDDQRYPSSASRGGFSQPGSAGSGFASAAGAARFNGAAVAASPPPTASRLSLESLDIEGMLNMATLQSERQYGSASRKNSDATILSRAMPSPRSPVARGSANPYQSQYLSQTPNENMTWQFYQPNVSGTGSPLGASPSPSPASGKNANANMNASASSNATLSVSPLTAPSPTFLRPLPTRNRNRRSPLDIPVDPDSMAFSGYSVNINMDAVADDGNPFNSLPSPIPRARNTAGVQGSSRSTSNSNRSPASQGRFVPEPLRTGDSFMIVQATAGGLPVSPSLPERGMGSGIPGARRSSADWYGIAR